MRYSIYLGTVTYRIDTILASGKSKKGVESSVTVITKHRRLNTFKDSKVSLDRLMTSLKLKNKIKQNKRFVVSSLDIKKIVGTSLLKPE